MRRAAEKPGSEARPEQRIEAAAPDADRHAMLLPKGDSAWTKTIAPSLLQRRCRLRLRTELWPNSHTCFCSKAFWRRKKSRRSGIFTSSLLTKASKRSKTHNREQQSTRCATKPTHCGVTRFEGQKLDRRRHLLPVSPKGGHNLVAGQARAGAISVDLLTDDLADAGFVQLPVRGPSGAQLLQNLVEIPERGHAAVAVSTGGYMSGRHWCRVNPVTSSAFKTYSAGSWRPSRSQLEMFC